MLTLKKRFLKQVVAYSCRKQGRLLVFGQLYDVCILGGRTKYALTLPTRAGFLPHPHSALQIRRMTGNQDRRSLFRGWSRLCLHAASINVTGAASPPVTTSGARGSQTVTVEAEDAAGTRKGVEAWEAAAVAKKRAAEVGAEAEDAGRLMREQGKQRAKRVVRAHETCEG